jgi:hypothetical protein
MRRISCSGWPFQQPTASSITFRPSTFGIFGYDLHHMTIRLTTSICAASDPDRPYVAAAVRKER